MRYPFIRLLIAFVVLITAGCGFHLRGNTQIPVGLQTLILNSNDPNGPLTREIRQQLLLNGVTIVEDTGTKMAKETPSLRILGSSLSKDTASVFQDGRTAEYQMVMKVRAHVLIPGHDIYPISATTFRSFFDNPLTALAKDAEQEIIIQEMYANIAQQLVRKLLSVEAADLETLKKAPQKSEEQTRSKPVMTTDPVSTTLSTTAVNQ